MKTTKRIIAVVLAALMMAAMIPFTVSAADQYTLNITSSKEGFEFEVIKVADLDLTTGNYSNASEAVQSALNKGDAQAALSICDGMDWTKETYSPVATYGAEDTGVKEVKGLAPGVYYVRCTKSPETVTDVTNRIIALPYFENGVWKNYDEVIDLASKLQINPVVTKKILDSKETDVYTTAAIGEDVKFELKATVTGSLSDKLATYAITDQMDEALTMKQDTIKVSLVKGSSSKDLTTDQYAYVPANGGFKIEINSEYLAGDEFYTFSNVVVTYSATLNEKAKIGSEGNVNSDGLQFRHVSDQEDSRVPGNTVYVFTIKIDVTKVDAADGSVIKDKKAKFALLSADKTVIAESYTVDGLVTFAGLDQGTYYVQETEAPEGYTLNTSLFEVVLDPAFVTSQDGVVTMTLDKTLKDSVDSYKLTVEDSKTVLPTTGGNGSLIFTIIGGSLIIAAGVLVVVVMKKRAK